jgi:hypothetical protein
MNFDPRATSSRTFVYWPLLVFLHGVVTRRRVDGRFVPGPCVKPEVRHLV